MQIYKNFSTYDAKGKMVIYSYTFFKRLKSLQPPRLFSPSKQTYSLHVSQSQQLNSEPYESIRNTECQRYIYVVFQGTIFHSDRVVLRCLVGILPPMCICCCAFLDDTALQWKLQAAHGMTRPKSTVTVANRPEIHRRGSYTVAVIQPGQTPPSLALLYTVCICITRAC